jgi:hypothetical protein
LQWYDTLGTPATPLILEEDDAHVPADDKTSTAPAASFAAIGDDHEDAARKQRVRKKRDVDSAFKARHSSRLTAKEPNKFVNMLSKANAAKASRFNSSTGSPRLHASALDAGFGADMVDLIPLPWLKAVAATCGIDPAAIKDATPVLGGVE